MINKKKEGNPTFFFFFFFEVEGIQDTSSIQYHII